MEVLKLTKRQLIDALDALGGRTNGNRSELLERFRARLELVEYVEFLKDGDVRLYDSEREPVAAPRGDLDELVERPERAIETKLLSESFPSVRVLSGFQTTPFNRVRVESKHLVDVAHVRSLVSKQGVILMRGAWTDSLMRELAHQVQVPKRNEAVISFLEGRRESLLKAGLRSIPLWTRPYKVLSTGQKARVEIACALDAGKDAFVADFGARIDALTLRAVCASLSRFSGSFRLFLAVRSDFPFVELLAPSTIVDVSSKGLATRRQTYAAKKIDLSLEISLESLQIAEPKTAAAPAAILQTQSAWHESLGRYFDLANNPVVQHALPSNLTNALEFKVLAVVGRSGSAKTSVVDVLFRNDPSLLIIDECERLPVTTQKIIAITADYGAEWLEKADKIFDCSKDDFVDVKYCRSVFESDTDLKVALKLKPAPIRNWARYAEYHYKSATLSNSSKCFEMRDSLNRPVGFCAIIPQVGRSKKGFRAHRTVVLPEFQGFGIGGLLTDAVGLIVTQKMGLKFFGQTVHPSFGRRRDASSHWIATEHNHTSSTHFIESMSDRRKRIRTKRTSPKFIYSHEFVLDGSLDASVSFADEQDVEKHERDAKRVEQNQRGV